jgi:hypothetical protein
MLMIFKKRWAKQRAHPTRLVIRSCAEGLGAWFNEERDVYADYAVTIGGEMPKQIVKVWFIAVSLFQPKNCN